jgi:hypothetical protein
VATVPVVVHPAPSGDGDGRNLCITKPALLLRNGVGGDNYGASRDRPGTELRRSFGLWRASEHAKFELAQLQHAELQCSRRAGGHAGACDIGSAGGEGKLRQGRSKLHHALHVDRNERHGNF